MAIIAKSETVVNAAEWDLEDLEILFGYRELWLSWKLAEVVVGNKVAFDVWPNSDGSGRQRTVVRRTMLTAVVSGVGRGACLDTQLAFLDTMRLAVALAQRRDLGASTLHEGAARSLQC